MAAQRAGAPRHRADGPAQILPHGRQEWWRDGYLHRVGGPAVIFGDGRPSEWWREGKRIAPEPSAEAPLPPRGRALPRDMRSLLRAI